MIALRPFIVYDLPKSRTTQALNGKKIEKAWESIGLFLANATTANIDLPTSIYMMGYSASEEFAESPGLADKVLEDAKKSFGIGEFAPISYHYPSGVPSKQIKIKWDLTSNDLSKSINHMIKGQPWPKYYMGPLELILSYDFKLIDPITKVELRDQQFESSILIWLSRSNSISPNLYFPFEEPNDSFWNYVNKIDSFLPFKLERKYLRLGRANKKGTANIYSKL
jgi:hypothetical protein